MATIYKILPASLWNAALSAGRFTGSEVDRRDGFIHFSLADQVAETAARHFADIVRLVVVPAPLTNSVPPFSLNQIRDTERCENWCQCDAAGAKIGREKLCARPTATKAAKLSV